MLPPTPSALLLLYRWQNGCPEAEEALQQQKELGKRWGTQELYLRGFLSSLTCSHRWARNAESVAAWPARAKEALCPKGAQAARAKLD